MGKLIWRILFLAVTLVALALECFAAWDGNPQTDPWTYLIVSYIPSEVFAFVFGGLVVWLTVHFGRRYLDKRRSKS